MNQTILINLALISGLIAIALSLLNLWLGRKHNNLLKIFDSEQQPDNLEEVISSTTDLLKKLKSEQAETQSQVSDILKTLQETFQYSSVIRFNSSGSDGGNLSFSLAMLNKEQSGIVLTSLHGREHNRIYCKAVSKGESTQQLSQEEKQAFMEALTQRTEKITTSTQASKKT